MSNRAGKLSWSGQSGVGLVEIMVSMAIGLTVLIALGYFFVGGKQMNRTSDDVSRMQESGRYAMEILGKAFRQAGYRLDLSKTLYRPPIDGPNASSIVTMRHDPVAIPHVAGATLTARETDCTGTVITPVMAADPVDGLPKNSALVEYVFSFSSANRELRCGGRVVADNIENIQITYGVDSNGDGVIDAWQIAVPTNTATIVAARVSLLVRSPSPNISVGPQTYFFNGQSITSNDGFLRQVYTSTFTLRNQAI